MKPIQKAAPKNWLGLGGAAAKQGGGEERAHNRANGGYGEASSVTANHPFAVLREFAVQRMPKSL